MSKTSGSKVTARVTPMTQRAASRITSATAKANGGCVPKGSFAARVESAATRSTSRK